MVWTSGKYILNQKYLMGPKKIGPLTSTGHVQEGTGEEKKQENKTAYTAEKLTMGKQVPGKNIAVNPGISPGTG